VSNTIINTLTAATGVSCVAVAIAKSTKCINAAGLRPIATDVLTWHMSHLVAIATRAKMAKPVEMLFGALTHEYPSKQDLLRECEIYRVSNPLKSTH